MKSGTNNNGLYNNKDKSPMYKVRRMLISVIGALIKMLKLVSLYQKVV